MASPVFYLLAGPNGAGKSTLYLSAAAERLIPTEAEFVNADLHEAAHLQHVADPAERSRQARQWSDARRAQCLAEGRSFASETVFSHTSKLDLMSAAQRVGFAVVLLVVCVDDPQQLLGRVSQRVEEGGHPVPPERVLARYPRTVRHLSVAVRRADLALLYDTSLPPDQAFQPPRLVARLRGGELVWQADALPGWARRVLHPMSE
ncbi:MAG: zeta toxin family protein [Hydrogenophaga sp.]|uniref:AAA family ATPase n=1 Tax=Hydrogenophaga sp. TaxID=1904254 RepID=UPI0025C3335B|nr:AAA family ATPase [Hydrogenophaga sp.]MBT9552153.1 zeta toxin family protein [Hydrogenophaga sp.]